MDGSGLESKGNYRSTISREAEPQCPTKICSHCNSTCDLKPEYPKINAEKNGTLPENVRIANRTRDRETT